jgi:hypothetical protein
MTKNEKVLKTFDDAQIAYGKSEIANDETYNAYRKACSKACSKANNAYEAYRKANKDYRKADEDYRKADEDYNATYKVFCAARQALKELLKEEPAK